MVSLPDRFLFLPSACQLFQYKHTGERLAKQVGQYSPAAQFKIKPRNYAGAKFLLFSSTWVGFLSASFLFSNTCFMVNYPHCQTPVTEN
jgi:hypothetical protein